MQRKRSSSPSRRGGVSSEALAAPKSPARPATPPLAEPGALVVVSGACGYLARHLLRQIVRRYPAARVRGFDLLDSLPAGFFSRRELDRIEFVRADLTKLDQVCAAVRGAAVVFHPASLYARLGTAALLDAVNIRGTHNVVQACRLEGVARLVYTSSHNVCFEGHEIVDGDNKMPYADPAALPDDMYTRSKVAGEIAVRAANCDELMTVAVRACGIFGPGEALHIPRALRLAKAGLFKFGIGSPDIVTDWTYVENLVDGHILACNALAPGSPVCGNAYVISDCNPISNFELLTRVLEGIGYQRPTIWLPIRPFIIMAWLFYWLFCVLEWFGAPTAVLNLISKSDLLFTPMESYKLAVTHTFSNEPALRDLGYKPRVSTEEGVANCVRYLLEHGEGVAGRK